MINKSWKRAKEIDNIMTDVVKTIRVEVEHNLLERALCIENVLRWVQIIDVLVLSF